MSSLEVPKLANTASMKNVTLIFPSILELVDFTMKMRSSFFEVNRIRLSVTGIFSEEDIELACKDYRAIITEVKEKK